MQIFEKLITATKDDLDELNHVNNVRYVQWVNDIAKEHWLQEATPKMLENYIWVVLKHCIEYKNPAFLNEIIKLRTYVSFSEGVTSTRVVEFYNNNNNKLLAKSEINFCLINAQNSRPIRIPQDISQLFS